jgi:S1-C subfamily serine protease
MLVTFFFAAAPASYGAASLLSPEAKRDLELQPGVVLIVASFKASVGPFSCTPAATGSGFLYRPDGYLITNGHVAQWAHQNDKKADVARIKGAIPCLRDQIVSQQQNKLQRELTDNEQALVNAALMQLINEGSVRISEAKLQVYLDNGSDYQGDVKQYSDPTGEGKDIAIVKIDGKNFPTVALGNSDEVSVGDPMTVIGYPGAATNATLGGVFSEGSLLVPTVTNGRISAVNKANSQGTPVLQSEATINHGNSGGPAFDGNGRVIGVATYMLNESAGLNFFVPINTALEFVGAAGAPPQRGPFDQAWHNALEAYGGQHWYSAHEQMGSVLEILPKEPDAQRLQLQATNNINQLNPISRLIDRVGLPMFLGIAGAAVAVIVVVVLLLTVKPKAKSSPATVRLPHSESVAPPPLPPAGVTRVTEPVKPLPPTEDSYGSLHVTSGPLSGNRFLIPKAGLLIGRDPSRCAVVLANDSVSKEHAWVVPLDNGVAVVDRNSSNGTYVNSTDSPRINKVVLKNGDRIFIGRKDPVALTYFSS